MKEIQYAQSAKEIESCWEVVHELRPHLNKEDYLGLVEEMMQDGFKMIYIEEDNKPVAFAGFRNMTKLYSGRIIYIDDLGTLPEYRGRGYAGQLLDYIQQLAKDTGKVKVQLDSGHQRFDAHRLYLNKRFKIVAHHFLKSLE